MHKRLIFASHNFLSEKWKELYGFSVRCFVYLDWHNPVYQRSSAGLLNQVCSCRFDSTRVGYFYLSIFLCVALYTVDKGSELNVLVPCFCFKFPQIIERHMTTPTALGEF